MKSPPRPVSTPSDNKIEYISHLDAYHTYSPTFSMLQPHLPKPPPYNSTPSPRTIELNEKRKKGILTNVPRSRSNSKKLTSDSAEALQKKHQKEIKIFHQEMDHMEKSLFLKYSPPKVPKNWTGTPLVPYVVSILDSSAALKKAQRLRELRDETERRAAQLRNEIVTESRRLRDIENGPL